MAKTNKNKVKRFEQDVSKLLDKPGRRLKPQDDDAEAVHARIQGKELQNEFKRS